MSYQIRLYRGAEDDEKLVNLLNTVNQFDGNEEIYTLESFRQETNDPILDAKNSYFLAETANGEIIGDIIVVLRESGSGTPFGSFFYEIHPDWRKPEQAVLENLIKRGEARLIQRRGEVAEGNGLLATIQANADQDGFVAIFEQLGYAFERTYYTMMCTKLDNVIVPEPPQGITIRNYRLGEDEEKFVTARNEAWVDHHLGSKRTLESWKHHVESGKFRPELTFLAEDVEGKVAGICWCEINTEQIEAGGPKEGWVDNLAVLREYRKIGLGAALLLRGVAAMAQVGMERVMLGVDAASPTGAVGLYERAGFEVYKKRLMYAKKLD
jgi:mycothiol synthase